MNRSRRAAATAATAALAALTLSACGSTQLGAAALVDGRRITISDVERTVETVRDQLEAVGAGVARDEQAASNEVHRRVTGMVFAQAAGDLGVSVTDGELDARAAQERAAAGSEEAFLRRFALQNRIPPDQVYPELRRALLIQKMTAKIARDAGIAVTDDAVRPRLTQFLVDTAQKMVIKINPRYGRFDAQTGDIVPTEPDYFRKKAAVGGAVAGQ